MKIKQEGKTVERKEDKRKKIKEIKTERERKYELNQKGRGTESVNQKKDVKIRKKEYKRKR
jgi:hypothetical protein